MNIYKLKFHIYRYILQKQSNRAGRTGLLPCNTCRTGARKDSFHGLKDGLLQGKT